MVSTAIKLYHVILSSARIGTPSLPRAAGKNGTLLSYGMGRSGPRDRTGVYGACPVAELSVGPALANPSVAVKWCQSATACFLAHSRVVSLATIRASAPTATSDVSLPGLL